MAFCRLVSLPQLRSSSLELFGCRRAAALAEQVPLGPADLIDRIGRPTYEMEGFECHDRVGGVFGNHRADPLGTDTGHELQRCGTGVEQNVGVRGADSGS
jgi:hypothetical protein